MRTLRDSHRALRAAALAFLGATIPLAPGPSASAQELAVRGLVRTGTDPLES